MSFNNLAVFEKLPLQIKKEELVEVSAASTENILQYFGVTGGRTFQSFIWLGSDCFEEEQSTPTQATD